MVREVKVDIQDERASLRQGRSTTTGIIRGRRHRTMGASRETIEVDLKGERHFKASVLHVDKLDIEQRTVRKEKVLVV